MIRYRVEYQDSIANYARQFKDEPKASAFMRGKLAEGYNARLVKSQVREEVVRSVGWEED